MTQATLFGFSDADNRREAVIEVRDKIAEYLVNVEDNDELFPPRLGSGIGFYRASSTGGFHLNDRPYEDVERFIEHLNIDGFELMRIAKFEQQKQIRESDDMKPDEQEMVSMESSEEDVLSYIEEAMQRVNKMDVDEENLAILGQQVNGLRIQTVPRKKVISGVESHHLSVSSDEFRQIDGTWIVEETQSFLENTEDDDFKNTDRYVFDCTGEKPSHIQPPDVKNRDGFVVTVGTKY